MVNVIIYLDKTNEAKVLVATLLQERLIANASIDTDNSSYKVENNEIVKSVNCVITAQTKSLLFSHIEKHIMENYGENVQIYSLPITQANSSFDTLIRDSTKKV